jgi:hypothetical protein
MITFVDPNPARNERQKSLSRKTEKEIEKVMRKSNASFSASPTPAKFPVIEKSAKVNEISLEEKFSINQVEEI